MSEIKVFDKWSVEGIKVEDPGLKDYISLKPVIVPKTGAKYAGDRFHKSRVFIVERFINKLAVTGHKAKKHKISSGRNTGKTTSIYKAVESAFEIIEKRDNVNPIEFFVKALENAAPREEIITTEYGGARYPKAVESAPQRRIDVALRQMAQGIYQKCFNSKKSFVDSIVDELTAAHNSTQRSAAIAKKLELERQADASR